MPQLGESVTEGTLDRWLVKEGDFVNQYDPLCEVVTDKVNAEVPSTCSGIVSKIVVKEGETVEVGRLICYIEEQKEALKEADQAIKPPMDQEKNIHTGREKTGTDSAVMPGYSPVVRRLAKEYGLDLEAIKGTGKDGRITRKDVLQLIQSKELKVRKPAVEESPLSTGQAEDVAIPLSPVRRAIANKMIQSKSEIPHAWTMIEVDVTNLVQYREKMKEEFKKNKGVHLTYLPFFIKAAAAALRQFPQVNSQWAGDKIIQKKEINISISVATEEALFVPVIKRADQKSILELAREINQLAKRTREGKLTPQDVKGGTFTVNNIGSFGTILSQPIINYPQAAILSVEAITARVVVIDGMIAVRHMVNLCLSLDHRILDGLVCGRFLKYIKDQLEKMGEGMDLE
jgi:2-oxoisovalerate dehydrogenase E2 component (dihydrolipoyl transacylase)